MLGRRVGVIELCVFVFEGVKSYCRVVDHNHLRSHVYSSDVHE